MGKHKGGEGGTVLNLASIAGLSPIPLAPIYGGTHHAVVGFSTALKVSNFIFIFNRFELLESLIPISKEANVRFLLNEF